MELLVLGFKQYYSLRWTSGNCIHGNQETLIWAHEQQQEVTSHQSNFTYLVFFLTIRFCNPANYFFLIYWFCRFRFDMWQKRYHGYLIHFTSASTNSISDAKKNNKLLTKCSVYQRCKSGTKLNFLRSCGLSWFMN